MAVKNKTLIVQYTAWDTTNNVGKTGDAANHTLKIIKDGVAIDTTSAITEIDSVNVPGLYKITLSSDDMNGDFITLAGSSSTSNVSIIPVHIATERGLFPSTTIAAQTDVLNVQTNVNSLLVDSTSIQSDLNIIQNNTNNIPSIKTQTDKIQFDINNNIKSNPQTSISTSIDSTSLAQISQIVENEVSGIKTQTDKIQFDVSNNIKSNPQTSVTATIDSTSLNEITQTIQNEINKAFNVNTISELSSGNPPVTPTLTQAIMLLYMALRNATQTTRTEVTIKDSSGNTITKASLSYDGVKFNKGKYQAP